MTIDDLENKYPKRDLPIGAEVVRVSPSPTGFVHLGLLYMASICERIARNSKGIFILRIEDTDTAREVIGAKEKIVEMLAEFGIKYDEGIVNAGLSPDPSPQERGGIQESIGIYGPYVQSERKEIYDICIDYLLETGRAYKCYMSVEELDELRQLQTENKTRTGVYGQYAKWRPDVAIKRMSQEKYDKFVSENELDKGDKNNSNKDSNNNSKPKYVIRFYSKGNELNKFKFYDEILGDMEVPENDEDFVLRKADGLPTYHLAHVVDDHYMRTTFVLRGNEWWASLGKHIELWNAFDWDIPKYGHLMPINKQETVNVSNVSKDGTQTQETKLITRKLSKRKDPEADVQYFLNMGYMPEAVMAYILRLLNPSFDDWMRDKIKNNEKINIQEFPFNIKELSRGGRGPLLDMPKLNNISSEMFACINNIKLDNMIRGWALYYDRVFFTALAEQLDYNPKVFGIERLCFDNYTKLDVRPNKIRKDIVKLSDIKQQYYYFWDELYQEEKSNRQLDNNYPFSSSISIELKEKITNLYVSGTIVSMDIWLAQMKEFSIYFGYDKFANFMRDLRLAITLEEKTPNLYDVMAVMGVERVVSRL